MLDSKTRQDRALPMSNIDAMAKSTQCQTDCTMIPYRSAIAMTDSAMTWGSLYLLGLPEGRLSLLVAGFV